MMFFRGSEPENVDLEGIAPMLDLLFDKKLGDFQLRASRLESELEEEVKEFIEACNELSELDAEPDTEDMYITNYSSIKMGKSHYASALKNAVNSASLKPSGSNAYEKYLFLSRNLDNVLESIQKVNASFKTVMYSYSNYLRKFKKSFSSIERTAKQLGMELESRRRDYGVYNSIADEVKGLRLAVERAAEAKDEINALNASSSQSNISKLESNEAKISEEITSKHSEISKNERAISELSARIQSSVAPLHRASKKFDHLSAKKQQLHVFIEDPIKNMSTDAEYNEFIQLLKELKDYLQKGKLNIEGKSDVLYAIESLLSHGINADIKELSGLEARKMQMLEEAASMSKVLDEVAKGKMSHQHSLSEIKRLEKEVEESGSTINSGKAKIESMFIEHYRKKIKIALA